MEGFNKTGSQLFGFVEKLLIGECDILVIGIEGNGIGKSFCLISEKLGS
jgi:hypothetical protein